MLQFEVFQIFSERQRIFDWLLALMRRLTLALRLNGAPTDKNNEF